MAGNETTITIDTLVQRVDRELLTSELGDELVMMDVEKGNYISLNKMGRIIWDHLEDPITIKGLIAKLMEKYNVEKDVCAHDTLKYLEEMYEKEIVSIV
jgi:hypothetical protein